MKELDMRMPVTLSQGAPDSSTPGWVGQLAMDMTQPSKPVYKCVEADSENKLYIWKPFDGVDVVQTTGERTDAVMSQAAVTKELNRLSADSFTYANYELPRLSEGHFYGIPYSFDTYGDYWHEKDGEISKRGRLTSSGMMPAPKNLCLHFGSSGSAKCFIYFYTKNENGEYEVTFEPFKISTTAGVLNYVTSGAVVSRMIPDIPDETYMQICREPSSTEEVTLFSWDGEPFGMDVCAVNSTPESGGDEQWFTGSGNSGITVSGNAKHIITRGAKIANVHGYKDGAYVRQLTSSSKNHFKLTEGFDYFRIKLIMDGDTKKSLSGNVRDLVYIVADKDEEKILSSARQVLENCEKVCSFAWTPKANIYSYYSESSGHVRPFKAGVEYNGLPYSGVWSMPYFFGWHVSPHTFINAINDDQSIMYKQSVSTSGIFSVVCSAFATMCDGWEYPQTNAGFFYDPDIKTYFTRTPPVGMIYTDATGHCLIPSNITEIGDDVMVSAYESLKPLCTETTRFMSIGNSDIWSDGMNHADGRNYYKKYGYAVHNPRATGDLSNVPYLDFANVSVTNGSARPFKGDKSTYSSTSTTITINIKNADAKILYLERKGGSVQAITIPNGAVTVNVRDYLTENGIYYVYTDADSVKESFEYFVVSPIKYTLTKDSLTFEDNDFWYANCVLHGLPQYEDSSADGYEERNCCVPANADNDYSKWFKNGWVAKVTNVFKKGRYGAYTVPVEMA